MKICVKNKLAPAVAASVIALAAGAIAQSQSSGQPPNEYAPTTKPSVNTHMSNRGYNNTPNAGQNQQSFADEATPSNRQKKGTKHKARTSTKNRRQQNQQNQGTQTNGQGY